MRAELYRPDEPEAVVAVAVWDGAIARMQAGEGAPEGIEAVLRPIPVVVEDASLRRIGTHGESVLQPGTPGWFRSALLTRGAALGLAVRFVPGVREGGWDPAARDQTFEEQVERLSSSGP